MVLPPEVALPSGWIRLHALATALLLLISGLGFLQQSRRLGYWMGNVAGIWLWLSAAAVAMINQQISASAPMLVYGTVILIAVNAHYRDAFHRP